jgi:hypothetical protein
VFSSSLLHFGSIFLSVGEAITMVGPVGFGVFIVVGSSPTAL